MRLNFVKMHGCGNDYIYFDCFKQSVENPSELSTHISDRHFGVGGDGIILICPSDKADAKMRIFNVDGSEGKMCGNGIRCVGKYLYESGIAPKENLSIETLSGIKQLRLYTQNSIVNKVNVNMGKAELKASKIPVIFEKEYVINENINIEENSYDVTCVSMGNPHCVVFMEKLDNLHIKKIGEKFEHAQIFPEGVNTEFVDVISRNILKMRVWERGSGETLACGTGACAAAVAAVENGYCDKNKDIIVHLSGGSLSINYTDEAVYMTGDAIKIFEGTVEV